MERTKYEFDRETEGVVVADLIVTRRKKPIMLVHADPRGELAKWALKELIYNVKYSETFFPYAMLVKLEKIQIFQWDGDKLSEPIFVKKTEEIFKDYDPEFGTKKMFYNLLTGLTERWLHDLDFNWYMENPPGSKELAEIGLLE
ncbi:MAG: hypothetical protein F6K35_45030, partial [Okeania sp. SIO2H7]|nr:hypothetical protein [Okeania sp. SIO2H7]